MKRLVITLITLMFSAVFLCTYGQDIPNFMKKRKDAAKNALLNRTGKEADKAITKEVNHKLDKVFEEDESNVSPSDSASASQSQSSQKSSSSNAGMRMLMGAMGMSGSAANVKPVYEYDGMVKMMVTEYEGDDKKESETEYITYIDSKSFDYGMEFKQADGEGTSLIIFDTENNLMVTLGDDNGEKTGFAINFTPEQAEAISSEIDSTYDEVEIENKPSRYAQYKTGKKKKILGYNCEEYVIEDPNDIVTMWITDKMKKEVEKSYLQNATFSGLFMHAYYADGVVMEYIIEDLDDQDKTTMTVTEIDMKKKNAISTAGYQIINMGNVMQETETESETESE